MTWKFKVGDRVRLSQDSDTEKNDNIYLYHKGFCNPIGVIIGISIYDYMGFFVRFSGPDGPFTWWVQGGAIELLESFDEEKYKRDKFSHHMKRVENRHLLKKQAKATHDH